MNKTASHYASRRSSYRIVATVLLTGAVGMASAVSAPSASAAVLSPSNVVAIAVNATTVQVQWRDNSSSEQRYSVRLTDQATFQLLSFDAAVVAGSGSTAALTITDLTAGHTYRPTVCAMATSGTFSSTCAQGANVTLPSSSSSPTTTQPPAQQPVAVAAPTISSVTRIGASTVRVNWNHPGGATKFWVFVRVAAGGNWIVASTEPGSARTTTVAPLLINTNYQLAVCAVNSSDQSVCSPTVPVFLSQGF